MIHIKNILSILSLEEKKQLFFLFFINLLVALSDMVGVASIMPFISLLSDQQLINKNPVYNKIYIYFNFTDPRQFVFVFGLTVFSLIVMSISLKALTTYLQIRFALMREYTIGKRLIKGYLNHSYVWFLNKNSGDLGKSILSELQGVIVGSVLPMLIIVSQGFVVLALLCLLFFVDINLALILGIVIIISYLIINKGMSGPFSNIGIDRVKANKDRFIAVNEAFGGIKEVKVNGLEDYYTDNFSRPSKIYASNQASAQLIAQMPKFLIEGIAFGLLLVVLLYYIYIGESLNNIIPVVSMYAFAAYRLLPALQQVYGSFSQIKFSSPSLKSILFDLSEFKHSDNFVNVSKNIDFKNELNLKDITFYYPNSLKPALFKINLSIPVNSTIGFVGSTGSGKTTILDIILGLLDAQEGQLLVDGELINNTNRRQWQKTIGFVPQQIYLSDDTIASNIAFGVPKDEINLNAVEKAAKISNLHEFVIKDLKEGYNTIIGERGVRLSGGQRQRIGIARALYYNPKILILDEATSALDNVTENAVMEAINNLNKGITIIMVAHRLTTVMGCDIIFCIENGVIKAKGTFNELKEEVAVFKTMTNV
jgi:ABC-type multidrug transport system fused ATPase/permease subunit